MIKIEKIVPIRQLPSKEFNGNLEGWLKRQHHTLIDSMVETLSYQMYLPKVPKSRREKRAFLNEHPGTLVLINRH